jgi:hypothetical protein
MALELFFKRAPTELGLLVAENLHNMLLADVHIELDNIIDELSRAQTRKEEILLCPHCDYLFDLDDCVWADLDDTSEGPHFNCKQNGCGHTCPRCEKRSTNKLIKIVGYLDKYMSLGCYSLMFGAPRGRTAQTIAWCASCGCASCRSGILSLELCTRFANSCYEQFHMREENHPLYNKPRHQHACKIYIEGISGRYGIYFGDSNDGKQILDPTESTELELVGKFKYTYRIWNEPIGRVVYLSENTVRCALESIGVDLNIAQITLPPYRKIEIDQFLSSTINSCLREVIQVQNCFL